MPPGRECRLCGRSGHLHSAKDFPRGCAERREASQEWPALALPAFRGDEYQRIARRRGACRECRKNCLRGWPFAVLSPSSAALYHSRKRNPTRALGECGSWWWMEGREESEQP